MGENLTIGNFTKSLSRTNVADQNPVTKTRGLRRLMHETPHSSLTKITVTPETIRPAVAGLQNSYAYAEELLALCALLATDAIPIGFLARSIEYLDNCFAATLDDRFLLAGFIADAQRLSLIKYQQVKNTFTLHRSVRMVLLSEMDQVTHRQKTGLAIHILNDLFPVVEPANWSQCAALVPHVRTLAKFIDSDDLICPEAARLLHQAGYFLLEHEEYRMAEPLLREALRLHHIVYGEVHPKVAVALSNLATLMKDTDRLIEAEDLLHRALFIDERNFGLRAVEVAIDLNNLATVLQLANRRTEAELLLQRALLIDEAAYGGEHPRVAMGLNNLATILLETGRFFESEQLLLRVVKIFQKSLGENHPYTLIGYENYRAVRQK